MYELESKRVSTSSILAFADSVENRLIIADSNSYRDFKLSERTVHSYIHNMKTNSYLSVQKKFYISRKHVTSLLWAIKHQDWCITHCFTVMITG